MFEKAVRLKLRFQHKGALSVEDLWDLPMKDLDAIYIRLNQQLKALSEESLLEDEHDNDREYKSLALSVVKHVFITKKAEAEERAAAVEKKAKKQRLMEILAAKQDEKFQDMTIDELNALIAGL